MAGGVVAIERELDLAAIPGEDVRRDDALVAKPLLSPEQSSVSQISSTERMMGRICIAHQTPKS